MFGSPRAGLVAEPDVGGQRIVGSEPMPALVEPGKSPPRCGLVAGFGIGSEQADSQGLAATPADYIAECIAEE